MPRAESSKDIYTAYYLCRLSEVTDKSSPRQVPRQTTAQSNLKARKALLRSQNAEGNSDDEDDDDLSEKPSHSEGDHRLVSAVTTKGRRITRFSEVHLTSERKCLNDAKQFWSRRTGMRTSVAAGDVNISEKMLSRISKLSSGVLRRGESLPAIVDQPTGLQKTSKRESRKPLEEPSDSGLSGENLVRAAMIMKEARFFKDLEPAILEILPKQAYFLELPKDAIVFRQGDPPKNCYIVVSGCVGFYVGDKNCKSPRFPCHDGLENAEVPPLSPKDARVNTYEKWSTFSYESKLGRLVFQGKQGIVFGELALMDDNEARKATAKCLEKSEFLAVPATAFDTVKAHIKEVERLKQEFLGVWVPGMKSLRQPGPKDPPHPAIYFHQFTCPKDHVFLKQGVKENPGLYVMISGAVKLCSKGEPDSEGVHGQVTQDLLKCGAVFGSLPHLALEPFTVMVHSDTAEVYKVSGKDYRYLPPHVIEEIHASISADAARRLRRCCVNQRMGWEAQEKFAQSQPRAKDAKATELLKLPARELKMSLMKTCM